MYKFTDDFASALNVSEASDKYGFVIKDDKLFRHHHYEDLIRFLQFYNNTYPSITRMHSIGQTVNGRELMVLTISSTPEKHMPGEQFIHIF